MTRSRLLYFCANLRLVLLLGVLNARSEEGGHGAAAQATNVFKWINFAIVAGLLVWVFLKVTPPFFRRNAEIISSAITKASAAKSEADRQLREAQEKLAHLEQEIAGLRATAQREGAAEAERIRRLLQTETERIAAAAKAEIQASERAARLELKAIAANLAVDGAESLLAKQLTPQAQESLVSAFVKSLVGSPN
jgi:F-type H+-transporting ATPase subunit b